MLDDLGLVSVEEVWRKADSERESGRSRKRFSPVYVAAWVLSGVPSGSSLLDAVADVIDHDWEGTDALAESASGMSAPPLTPPAPVSDFDCENNALAAMAWGGKTRIRPRTIVMPNLKDRAARHDVLVLA